MKHRPAGWLFLSLLVMTLLAACSSTSALPLTSDSRTISAGSSFGQSFTAQNNGLSGISVLLGPTQSIGTGSLLFHLRTGSQVENDLAQASLPLTDITRYGYYKFDFSPQSDSQRKDYFLQVEVKGKGQVQIYTNGADTYLDGALYENQIPQEAQLDFTLQYYRLLYLVGVGRLIIKWAGVLAIGIFSFILPGWALFSLLWRDWDDLNWFSKLGLSAGLSIAIYPLLLLWTNLVGIQLGRFNAWFPPLAGIIALAWKYRGLLLKNRGQPNPNSDLINGLKKLLIGSVLADLAAVVIIGLVIFSRLWVIRTVDVPLFGDSYQHTLITQLIIDHGGLFNSWAPYADLTTLTYHFGFHSLAAVFHWIAGASSARAVLWTGQLVNIFAIIGLYPLAFKITKSKWAGVIAMLVGGLLSSMPMSYANWGRYTQLAGQVILSAVIWMVWSLLERAVPVIQNIHWFRQLTGWRHLSIDPGSMVIAWMAVSGLALTHYRILIIALLFIPAFVILSLKRTNYLSLIGRIFWIGIGGVILFLPWLIHVFGSTLLTIFSSLVTTLPTKITSGSEIVYSLRDLQRYLPNAIWILFFLCIAWGVVKRKKDLLIIILWWIFILLAANPQWLRLPGSDVISNFAVFIAFYLPVAVVLGTIADWIPGMVIPVGKMDGLVNKSKLTTQVLPGLILVLICAIGVWGLPKRIGDFQTAPYALVTRPDLRAMAWVRESTPADSIFLVNSFFAYNGALVVGSDGGWWLPLLAGRKTTLPPITYGFEGGAGSTNLDDTNDLNRQIQAHGITDPSVIDLLKQRGIRYIYIGQRQGRVNYSGPDVLDPQTITNDQHYATIYHQDRVWIFELAP